MANSDRPSGLKPVKHLNGNPWNGQVHQYNVTAGDTTAIYVGDIVKLAGSASADGYPTITNIAATTDIPLGVVVGFRVSPTDLNITGSYRAASTARYALVCDDPAVVFQAQEDGGGGALGVAGVGLNCAPLLTTGSTTTGQSAVELDSSTATTTNTAMFKIVGFADMADNDPTLVNAKVLVVFNVHQMTTFTGTQGI